MTTELDKQKARERAKAWRAANPERTREISKKCREKNRDKILATQKAWRANNPTEYRRNRLKEQESLSGILAGLRGGAKRRNLAFDLTPEEFKSKVEASGMRCTVSGRPLNLSTHSPDKLSLDRIDSDKGYSFDNVQVVALCVNLAKNSLSMSDFITLCHQIANGNPCPSNKTSQRDYDQEVLV